MRKHVGFAALLIFSMLISPALSVPAMAAMPASVGVQAGQTAPDFTLKDLNGHPVTLSQFKGKVVVLNFWATWCPPCRAEMPSMERLNEVYGSKDFVILAVNVEEDGKETVKAFLEKNPHNFTILLDSELKAQDLYGVYQFPETFIINKKGQVVERVIGAVDWSSVEVLKYFSTLLNG
jgi:thiol-disulfide isomerase/thioredoxin